jgi:ADP-heptose:LPS heptosyltransferase
MQLKVKQTIDLYLGGFLLLILRPLVFLVGKVMRRDHQLSPKGEVCFLKMLGGGSLVIAAPSLIALRKARPDLCLSLVTTKALVPFAQSLHVFDKLYIIDESSLFRLCTSSMAALLLLFRVDTFVDLEIHSRLSTVFSVFTCARNRIGFYLASAYFRRYLHSHLLFANVFNGSYFLYEKVLGLFNVEPCPFHEVRDHLLQSIPQAAMTKEPTHKTIVIGHACSEFGKERQLSPPQWQKVFQEHILDTPTTIIFLGSRDDMPLAQEIIDHSRNNFPNSEWQNLCGTKTLEESLSILAAADEFWGIDSALLHYGRILVPKCVSFWGPTRPKSRLKPNPDLQEEIHYAKVQCSPCIHVAEEPPCQGNNICMTNIFSDQKTSLAQHPGIILLPNQNAEK